VKNRFGNTVTAINHKNNKKSQIPGFITQAGSYGYTGNLLDTGK
jgi:hypothetical protein